MNQDSGGFKGEEKVIRSESDDKSDSNKERLIIAMSRINETDTMYEKGVSYHFIFSEYFFLNLQKRSKPFNFGQAVGNTSLNNQGTAIKKIGNLILELNEPLSSLDSCNFMPVGRI